jgi:hypothetical protein
MRKRRFVLALGLTAITVFALPGVAQAQPGSVTFDPSSTVVAGGAKVFINVTCEANTEGFILSHAFAGQPGISEFASVPAIPFQSSGSGTFGVGVTIDPQVSPGNYSVTVRCGGGLAASGTLHVRSSTLAFTGNEDKEIAASAAALMGLGAALARFGRRRMRAVRG